MAKYIWHFLVGRTLQEIENSNEHGRPWLNIHVTSFWNSLKQMKPLFNISLNYTIRNGEIVRLWHDAWQGPPPHPHRETLSILYTFVYNQHMTVKQVKDITDWDSQFRQPLTQQAQQLQQVQIQPQQRDHITWKYQQYGIFTVKTCYRAIKEGPHIISSLRVIWNIKMPRRIEVFAWLLLQNKIFTIDNLIKRGWMLPNMCYLCRRQQETAQHLFTNCEYTQRVRNMAISDFSASIGISQTLIDGNYEEVLLQGHDKKCKRLQMTIYFVIWKEKCSRIFREK
jgi:zinc-binding in reverse transcriptase